MSSNEMYHCCSIIAMAYYAKRATVHADSVMKLTSADGIIRKLFQLLSWEKDFPISMHQTTRYSCFFTGTSQKLFTKLFAIKN